MYLVKSLVKEVSKSQMKQSKKNFQESCGSKLYSLFNVPEPRPFSHYLHVTSPVLCGCVLCSQEPLPPPGSPSCMDTPLSGLESQVLSGRSDIIPCTRHCDFSLYIHCIQLDYEEVRISLYEYVMMSSKHMKRYSAFLMVKEKFI